MYLVPACAFSFVQDRTWVDQVIHPLRRGLQPELSFTLFAVDGRQNEPVIDADWSLMTLHTRVKAWGWQLFSNSVLTLLET